MHLEERDKNQQPSQILPMNLHYETISSLLADCLKALLHDEVFNSFRLVGGTCLSLQLGHRRSIDIDLFTDSAYGSMDTIAIKRFLAAHFPFTENLSSLDKRALGYSVRIGLSKMESIKLDLFYTEPFIFPERIVDGIRLADIKEIAAMKMMAITQIEPRQKDFWDIYELSNQYTLQEMIDWAYLKDKWSFSESDVEKGFQTIFDVPECEGGIDCFRGYEWELIRIDLAEMANHYFSQQRDFIAAVEQGDQTRIQGLAHQGYVPTLETRNALKDFSVLIDQCF